MGLLRGLLSGSLAAARHSMAEAVILRVGGAQLRAPVPICRYLDGDRETKSRWASDKPGGWRWSDGWVTISSKQETHAAGTLLRLTMSAEQAARVQSCSLELRTDALESPYLLDQRLQWRALRDTTTVSDLTPLVLRWPAPGGGALELRSLGGSTACRLEWKAPVLSIRLTLDAAALHPRVQFSGGIHFTAAADWTQGGSVTVRLLLSSDRRGASAPPAVPSRFPEGREAAFVITDHADFDFADGLRVLLKGTGGDGWLGRGLRLTKSVFHYPATPPHQPPASSMAEATYARLIEELANEGSEIVPHALSEWGTLPADAFARGLAEFVARWRPRTWIDHGNTIMYCYTMGGADRAEYALLHRLREHGFTTLWSYCDIPCDPVASLNQIEPRLNDLGAVAPVALRHARAGEVLIALHYLRSVLDTRLSGPRGQLVRVLMSQVGQLVTHLRRTRWLDSGDFRAAGQRLGRALRHAIRNPPEGREQYTRAERLVVSPVLYPERPAPLGQVRSDELLLFTTSLVVHTRDAYRPENLAALVRERGIHIGHCYLLNRLPYIAGLFDPGASAPSQLWTTFVEALAAHVASGRIFNPVVSDLSAWLRGLQHVEVTPAGEAALDLVNVTDSPVRGFTVLLPPAAAERAVRWARRPPSRTCRWADWLAVWGDLPPGAAVTVEW